MLNSMNYNLNHLSIEKGWGSISRNKIHRIIDQQTNDTEINLVAEERIDDINDYILDVKVTKKDIANKLNTV